MTVTATDPSNREKQNENEKESPDLLLPDYEGGCLANLVPALREQGRPAPWLPTIAREAPQVVLLVLDGLGWEQLVCRGELAPTMSSMVGSAITSVAPTTTSTALSSIAIGCSPAEHGVVGYRVRVADNAVLNVLRWRTSEGDARESFPATTFQPRRAFRGDEVPVVTRAEFANTGFTDAHLSGARLVGWRVASNIAVEVKALLAAGERFVYAYYDGVDKVAHERGFGAHYDAELVAADRLVADLIDALPAGAALFVTSDHGQVEVAGRLLTPSPRLLYDVVMQSGEGRFRWLHAAPGRAEALAEAARAEFDHVAWVRTRAQVIDEGWFGGPLTPVVADRLGDVALVAREPVAFADPADGGSNDLVCRHGSLTPAEMLVPLLAACP